MGLWFMITVTVSDCILTTHDSQLTIHVPPNLSASTCVIGNEIKLFHKNIISNYEKIQSSPDRNASVECPQLVGL